MRNSVKFIIYITSILLFVGVAIFGSDIYRDMRHKIVLTGEITVYENADFYSRNTKHNKILRKELFLKEILVKRIIYGKDYMAIKVVMPTGNKGWVFYGDNFQLIRPS